MTLTEAYAILRTKVKGSFAIDCEVWHHTSTPDVPSVRWAIYTTSKEHHNVEGPTLENVMDAFLGVRNPLGPATASLQEVPR